MTIQYTPRGVCSRAFTIQVEDGLIQSVQVVGGCSGNLQGISMLLKGMPVEEAIRRMEVEDFPVTVVIDTLGRNLYETGRKAYLASREKI